MADMPPFEQLIRMEIVHRVPGMAEIVVRRDVVYAAPGGEPLTMDVYEPAGAAPGSRAPAVLMIHGGPVPKLGAKNMAVFTSYGRLLAASGVVAVTFNHRFLGPERLLDAARDVQAAADYVRDHAEELGVDRDRLAFWAFSGRRAAARAWLCAILRRTFARSSRSTRRSTCGKSRPARRTRSRTRRAATSRRRITSARRRAARRRFSSPAPDSTFPG